MRCKYCRKKIKEDDIKIVSSVVVVHRQCFDQYIKKTIKEVKDKKKQAKIEFQKVKKQSALSKTRDTAWKYFSWWARLRKADQHGMVKCYSCNRKFHWKNVDAGHYIAKSKGEYFYFNDDNVRPQCRFCNSFNADKAVWQNFRKNLIKDVGLKRVEELERLKYNPPLVKVTLPLAEKLKKKYLKKYKELKNERKYKQNNTNRQNKKRSTNSIG